MPNRTILLIDDDPALLDALSQTIELLVKDIKVETVESAGTALERLTTNKEQYDVIISDLSMPNINGFSLVQEIKDRGLSIPVILISGSVSMLERARYCRVFGVIPKPFDRRYMQRVLVLALRYSRVARGIQRGLRFTEVRLAELRVLKTTVEKQITLNQSVLQHRQRSSIVPPAISPNLQPVPNSLEQ